MKFQKLIGFVIGITFTRLLMSWPSAKMEAKNGPYCPAGYYGKNCFKICSRNTYGVGCRNSCHCSPEYCDPAIGCIQQPTTTTEKTDTRLTGVKEPPLRTDPLTFNLLLIVLVIVGCHFLLTVIRDIRKWMKDNVRRQTGNVADSSSIKASNKSDNHEGSEGIQGLHSDYYEPPIIPKERPENNVYTGISIV